MSKHVKYSLASVFFAIVGGLLFWSLYAISGDDIWTIGGMGVSLAYAGYCYGAARGWHDIELRRAYPDFFKNEPLD